MVAAKRFPRIALERGYKKLLSRHSAASWQYLKYKAGRAVCIRQGNALVGCTNSTVFVCPADGSRQCTGSKNTSGKCNEDGTAARRLPSPKTRNLRGDDLLQNMQMR
jgi:hypothetical protein